MLVLLFKLLIIFFFRILQKVIAYLLIDTVRLYVFRCEYVLDFNGWKQIQIPGTKKSFFPGTSILSLNINMDNF